MKIGHAATRAAKVLRDGWMILGVTVVLIVGLEIAYRAQGAARRAVAGLAAPAPAPRAAAPPSPFEATDWADDYWLGHALEEAVEWTPYVYIRNPTFTAPYHETDSLGRRVTPHPEPNGGRPLRVFFLGGSTTFGWYQRGDFTIPAEAARRLQEEVGDTIQVEVTNFGVPGQTFTQEIIELMLQLRSGQRPDIVVFYDGINDVMATIQNGRAGLPQNEANRRADFARGRRLAEESQPGLANRLRPVGRFASWAALQLEFVQRVLEVRDSRAAPADAVSIDALASSSVEVYVENVRLVEALSASYGFQPVYVWQPALLSTGKPLTEREKWLFRPQPIGDLHQAIPPLLGPAVTPVAGDRFVDATGLFDDDSLEVFVDEYGHTYERANPVIVDMLLPHLLAATERARDSR